MSVHVIFASLAQLLTSPYVMWMMLLGTAIGLVVGALPGLGGGSPSRS